MHVRESDAPPVPAWALALVNGPQTTTRVAMPPAGGVATEWGNVQVRTGGEAALVSVTLDSTARWDSPAIGANIQEMIRLSLDGLRGTPFVEPVRLWNFLPGICEPVADGLDRYRVFNMARHRAFEAWFGAGALSSGLLPTASCVGHHGSTIAVHALGAVRAATPVENPRQIPAFAYSKKFGPRPPCFSRAGLATLGGQRVLMVAGTASIIGEESMHGDSLALQFGETLVNLEAIIAEGRRVHGGASGTAAFEGVRAVRVYYRRTADLAWLRERMPREWAENGNVEFVHADICRDELLVEIEMVVDVGRA